MAWYKISVSYGPGHQGHEALYDYVPDEWGMSNEDLVEKFKLLFDYWHVWDEPILEYEKLAKLPEEVRQQKVAHYKKIIAGAEYMLTLLQ